MKHEAVILIFTVVFFIIPLTTNISQANTPDISVNIQKTVSSSFFNPDGSLYPWDLFTITIKIQWSIPQNTTQLNWNIEWKTETNVRIINKTIKTQKQNNFTIPIESTITLAYITAGTHTTTFSLSTSYTINNITQTKTITDSTTITYVNPPLPEIKALYPNYNNTFTLLLKAPEGKRIEIFPNTIRTFVIINNATMPTKNTIIIQNQPKPIIHFQQDPISNRTYFTTNKTWIKITLATNLTTEYMPATIIAQIKNETTTQNTILTIIPYAHAKALMAHTLTTKENQTDINQLIQLYTAIPAQSPINTTLTTKIHIIAYNENGDPDPNTTITITETTNKTNIEQLVNLFTNDTEAQQQILQDLKTQSQITITNNTIINTYIPYLQYAFTTQNTTTLYNITQIQLYQKQYNFTIPKQHTLYYTLVNNIKITAKTQEKTWQTGPHYLIWPGEPPLPINLHGIPITIKDNTIIITPKTGGITTIKTNNQQQNLTTNEYYFPYGTTNTTIPIPPDTTTITLTNSQNITTTITLTPTTTTTQTNTQTTNPQQILIIALLFLLLLIYLKMIIPEYRKR
jgi:hypothetical protein